MLDWKQVSGVQPTMTIDEQVECEQAVLASTEFREALKHHTGVEDASLVMVDIWRARATTVPRKTAPGGSPGRFASSDLTRPTTATSARLKGCDRSLT